MIKSFKWGSKFETGLTDIDDQHKSLVSMINEFGVIISSNDLDYDFIKATFTKLAIYAQDHFTAEEKLMQETQIDPRHVTPHLQQHFDFVSEVTNLFATVTVEEQNHSNRLYEYLIHWLVYHILGFDQKMARQIASISNGLSPEQAFEKENVQSHDY